MNPPRPDSADRANTPPPRIILIGASNLTRGLSAVLGSARLRLRLDSGQPLDAMIACGHGRSFVIESTVLFRTLPAIRACRLWDEVRERPPTPTYGLITDIGNDIMYDVPVNEIVAAIELCLERMRECDARLALTALPMASIRSVTPRRYRTVRQILFPTCRVTFAQAMERAAELDERVRMAANDAGANIVEPDGAWYGADPIHIKMKHWPHAWRAVLAPWEASSNPRPAPASLRRWLALKTMTPRHWALFGQDFARLQPAGNTPDGTTVSMY